MSNAPESAAAREFHRIIRSSVRECLETWRLQTTAGPITAEALELVVTRAAVPILRLLEDRPPELMVALLPSLVRVMLEAFLEVMTEQGRSGPRRPEDEGGRF